MFFGAEVQKESIKGAKIKIFTYEFVILVI